MRYYNQLCRFVCKVLMSICAILATVMLACTALQVFSRYVLGSSVTWTEECARYCFIWLDMLGAAVLVYTGGHAKVDLIAMKLHNTGKKIYQTIVYVCMGYVGIVLAVFGVQLTLATFRQTSPSLKLPMGFVYGVLPICGALILLFILNRILNVWKKDNEATELGPAQEGEQ